MNQLLKKGLVDIISISEVEARKYGQNKNTSKAIKNLANYCRVCVHNANYSQTFLGEFKTVKVPSFNIKPLRLTGAGDSWNSGYIYGELIGLVEEEKLFLANAVAGYYISSKDASHPTVKEIIQFIKKNECK